MDMSFWNQHLRIPTETKNHTVVKLQMGVAVDKNLNDVGDKTTGTIEREHLLSHQDVHNVQNQLNMKNIQKPSNDTPA